MKKLLKILVGFVIMSSCSNSKQDIRDKFIIAYSDNCIQFIRIDTNDIIESPILSYRYQIVSNTDTIKVLHKYKTIFWDSSTQTWQYKYLPFAEFKVYYFNEDTISTRLIFKPDWHFIDSNAIKSAYNELVNRKINKLKIDSVLLQKLICCDLSVDGDVFDESNTRYDTIRLFLSNYHPNDSILVYIMKEYKEFEKIKRLMFLTGEI